MRFFNTVKLGKVAGGKKNSIKANPNIIFLFEKALTSNSRNQRLANLN